MVAGLVVTVTHNYGGGCDRFSGTVGRVRRIPVPSVLPTPAAVAAPVGSGAVQVPRDEPPHGSPVEWWYFNGHLRGTAPSGQVRCYGFEYVTFQILGLTLCRPTQTTLPSPTCHGATSIMACGRPSAGPATKVPSHCKPTVGP